MRLRANHPARRMPIFMPKLAETPRLGPFEMSNSAPSHSSYVRGSCRSLSWPKITAGRTDLPARHAGQSVARHDTGSDAAVHERAARLCIMAGADMSLVDRWSRETRADRAIRTDHRRPPEPCSKRWLSSSICNTRTPRKCGSCWPIASSGAVIPDSGITAPACSRRGPCLNGSPAPMLSGRLAGSGEYPVGPQLARSATRPSLLISGPPVRKVALEPLQRGLGG